MHFHVLSIDGGGCKLSCDESDDIHSSGYMHNVIHRPSFTIIQSYICKKEQPM